MSKLTIKQGHHYHAFPPFSTLPWLGKKEMARYVTFDKSCAYDSAAYNADDVNKLFGLSFGFGGVHHNSARFGWRWSKSAQCIELLAYCYVNGVKNWDEQLRFPVVAQVGLNERIELEIVAVEHKGDFSYIFTAKRVHEIFSHTKVIAGPTSLPGFGLTHSFYFGGELTAPHDVSATITRP
jgi:hypothetical protein